MACGGGGGGAPRPAPTPPPSAAPSAAPAPPKGAAVTTRRSVVVHGRTAGTSVTTIAPDGAVSIVLDVLENGRGPHVEASLRVGDGDVLTAFSAKGRHTMGTPVDETFSYEGPRARWKSNEESGEATPARRAFYVPMATVPDALGFLAQALIRAGGSLPLLPTGEAHVERTGEARVTARGETVKVIGYAITGLELQPTRIWMREDGRWFATITPWWSVVPEGFEGVIDHLQDKQIELDRERERAIAKRLATKPPAAGVAFTHARLLDVEKGRFQRDMTVFVVGDAITWVGPADAAKLAPGMVAVDLSGKALLPGLWDNHAHLGDSDGILDVASGVTTARDVGNDPDKLDALKKSYDTGETVGPRVIRYGFVEGRGEKAASSKVTAETEAEAKAAVALFAGRGYEGIKIYNSVKPELVPVIAKEAHARGMAVTGHVPVHMLAHEAVRAGYDGIEHVNMLFLNFFADKDTDTRTTARFTLVGDRAASFDLASKPAVDFFALLKEKKTVIDPTLGVFEELLLAQPGKITPGLEGVVRRLPPQPQRAFLFGGLPLGDKQALYQQSFEKVLAMVRALKEHKIPILAGTDSLAGLMLHHELALLVRAGLTPAEAIRAATIDAARAAKVEKKTGSIDKGKAADLVVVDGDPLARIEDIGRVVTTVRGGVMYPSAALYGAVGVVPMAP